MQSPVSTLVSLLKESQHGFHPVVSLDSKKDRLFPFDFTGQNQELTDADIRDTERFSAYITRTLKKNDCRYGMGGYNEHRTIYARSKHFDSAEEPRRLHLGIDIWGDAGTKIMNPIEGLVH